MINWSVLEYPIGDTCLMDMYQDQMIPRDCPLIHPEYVFYAFVKEKAECRRFQGHVCAKYGVNHFASKAECENLCQGGKNRAQIEFRGKRLEKPPKMIEYYQEGYKVGEHCFMPRLEEKKEKKCRQIPFYTYYYFDKRKHFCRKRIADECEKFGFNHFLSLEECAKWCQGGQLAT